MIPTLETEVAFSPVGVTLPQRFAVGKVIKVSPVAVSAPLPRGTLSVEHSSMLPGRIRFAQLHHPALKVKLGFVVDLRRENENVIAFAEEFGEFGYGSSVAEALQDLAATVAELFLNLNASDVALSPDLANVRDRLRNHIAMV